jgi:DNA adenine methylase
MEPLIPWVGGKRRLLPYITARIPSHSKYIEPFVGAGAVLWTASRPSGTDKSRIINDNNFELINLYKAIVRDPDLLIEHSSAMEDDKDAYLAIRSWDRLEEFESIDPILRAARFYYILTKGFNGLWRVNSKGQCNTSYGGKNGSSYFPKAELIYELSAFLEDVTILHGDFEQVKPFIEPDTFVYMDPPYLPILGKEDNIKYTKEGFTEADHLRVFELCSFIDSIGAKFMLSGSSSDLMLDMCDPYNIEFLTIKRTFAGPTAGRHTAQEVIVTNY